MSFLLEDYNEDVKDRNKGSQTFCICCLKRNISYINLSTCSHAEYLNIFAMPQIKPAHQVVCYNCHYMLKKIKLFKLQVEDSFKLLAEQVKDSFKVAATHENNLEFIEQSLNNLKSSKVIEINIPQVIDIQQKDFEQDNNAGNITEESIINEQLESGTKTAVNENEKQSKTMEKDTTPNSVHTNKKHKIKEEALKIINGNKNNDFISLLATSLQSFAASHLAALTNVLLGNSDINNISKDEIKTEPVSNNTEILYKNADVLNNTEISNTIFSINKSKAQNIDDINTSENIVPNSPTNTVTINITDDINMRQSTSITTNIRVDETSSNIDDIHILRGSEEISNETKVKSKDTIADKDGDRNSNDTEMSNSEDDTGITNGDENEDNTEITNGDQTKDDTEMSNDDQDKDGSEMHIDNSALSNDTMIQSVISDGKSKIDEVENSLTIPCVECSNVDDSNEDRYAKEILSQNVNESNPGPTIDCLIKSVTITKEKLLQERSAMSNSKTYLNSPHRCETCLIGYYYKVNLEDHVKRKHTPKPFGLTCEVCQQVFDSYKSYAEHTERHYIRFECICGERFLTYEEAYYDHVPKCQRCGYNKIKKTKLKRRVCKMCGARFRTVMKLRSHMENKHIKLMGRVKQPAATVAISTKRTGLI